MRVPVRGLHLDHAAADLEHRNIERAAAEVIDSDGLVALFIQPVGQRCRCRLVDDADHFQTGDFTRLFGGLPLRVVEVRRHGDDGLCHLLAEEIFRRRPELLQNHCGDLRRAIRLAENIDARVIVRPARHLVRNALHLLGDLVVPPAHEALDGIDCVLRVRHRLALGHLTHQSLTGLGDGHNRWGCAAAFLVGDDDRFAALHHGDNGVRRPQVNSNNLAHGSQSSLNPGLPFTHRAAPHLPESQPASARDKAQTPA